MQGVGEDEPSSTHYQSEDWSGEIVVGKMVLAFSSFLLYNEMKTNIEDG